MSALPPSRRGGVTLERTVRFVSPGIVGLHQRFVGDGLRVIVTHRASLRATVQVLRGSVSFPLAAGEVTAPARFELTVGPRSVLPIRFTDAEVDSDGLGHLTASDERTGLRFDGDPRLDLDADANVSPALVRARHALHDDLSSTAPVRAAAEAFGLSVDTFTRAFERTYHVTPKQYCTRARLFDAALGLFSGVPILSAAFAAGFNDLSRFYASFRGVLRSTPGAYARAGNRQDAR